jgi:phosphoglycerate kinase
MKSIKEIKNLSNKKVIIRVDLNVPIKNDEIIDDFRIKKVIPTLQFLQKKGAKTIIISHLGEDGTESLAIVAKRMKKYIKEVEFVNYPILSDETERKVNEMKKGDIIMLRNLRSEEGEKKNSPSFARGLSRYGEIYVNDAFSVSHREHASVVGIAKHLPSYAGLQLEIEVLNLSKAFNPKHPFLFILGGAKFDTKIPLVRRFLRKADNIFIGGAIANDFLKAKGYEVGVSLCGDSNPDIKSFLKSKNLTLPTDVVVKRKNKNINIKLEEVLPEDCILDVGKETTENLKKLVSGSKFILWNGPLGKYENGFGGSTEEILKAITKSKAVSMVGGGDTTAIISKLKIENKIGFVSTGGGATLDFLAKGILPGIRALK